MAVAPKMVGTEAVQTAWQAAIEEILGPEQDVLGERLPSWQGAVAALCGYYGERAGKGLSVRIGRAFARRLVPLFAEQAGFQSAAFRFLPWPRKVVRGLERLGAFARQWFVVPVTVDVQETEIVWRFAACPFGATWAGSCALWQGFLQEILYWLSGGRWFAVHLDGKKPLLRVPRRPLH